MERTVKDLPTRAKEQTTSRGLYSTNSQRGTIYSVRVGGQFHQGGGHYMLGYIVRGGQCSLGYIVRGTLYPRLYCPGGQYKGGTIYTTTPVS